MTAPDDPTPETLVARFRAGDSEAFQQLVAPHLPALRARAARWLDRSVRKKVSLLDVVQEAQVVAFERRTAFVYEGPDSFGRWLLGILDNCARAAAHHFAGVQKRAMSRELTGELRPASSMLADCGPSPSQGVVAAERQRLLHEARATLAADEQELLHLVHDEHLSMTEAAARLARPYETVKKQHARALLRLGQAFRRRSAPDSGC
jgi:RNA polymerase sigma-70 factor (ECF subfamily)